MNELIEDVRNRVKQLDINEVENQTDFMIEDDVTY